MSRETSGRCARCGNTRSGAEHEFWYGRVIESDASREVSAYSLGGHASAFICIECIEGRRRRFRRVAVIVPVASFVILGGLAVVSLFVEDETTSFFMLGLLALLFGPLLVPFLLWATGRPRFAETSGTLLAFRARKQELHAEGQTVWTPEQFQKMAATARRVEPAVTGTVRRGDSGDPRGEYSFVRDESGAVRGVWLRDPAQANKQSLVMALLMKHGHAPELMLKGVRVVPNRVDGAGGSFVMFGGAPAPGEV